MKIAVNKEVAIPIIKVDAKPFTGPVPNMNKITPVNRVVMLASRIEDNALLKPSLIPSFKAFPRANSSLILSK